MSGTDINHAGRAHALLSASGSARWLNCTPSVRLEEHYDSESSIFAEEGTLAHEFGEIGLKAAMSLITEAEYKMAKAELKMHDLYTHEMDEHVEVYVSSILEMMAGLKNPKLLIEERVDYSYYAPGGFGTGDALILSDVILQVGDLKYGKGVQVYAEDNSQLKLYGLGALSRYLKDYPKLKTVRLTIIQPRLDHIDTWDISVEDLLKWGEVVVKPTAALAFAGEGELSVGSWCRWCKFAKCRALADFSIEAAKEDFAIDPEDVKSAGLTDPELVKLYLQMPIISNWIDKVQEYMHTAAIKGKKWTGLKLVEGRSARSWQDQDKVAAALRDNLYTDAEIMSQKLSGITEIEKMLGKKGFKEILGDLVVKPQGKASLVCEKDKRPEMGLQSARNDFSEPIEDLE